MVGKLDGRLLVLSARVSGHGQQGDLETQLERLQAWAHTERKGQETLVLSDIGSGLKDLLLSWLAWFCFSPVVSEKVCFSQTLWRASPCRGSFHVLATV